MKEGSEISEAQVALREKREKRERAFFLVGSLVIAALYGLSAVFTYLVGGA